MDTMKTNILEAMKTLILGTQQRLETPKHGAVEEEAILGMRMADLEL